MNPFINKQCQEYSKHESPLNLTEIEENRRHTPEWQFCATENELSRTFRFDNFGQTMTFVNKVADIAEQQDHHPSMEVSYSRCRVHYCTHSVGGLTENDFICAAKIDALM